MHNLFVYGTLMVPAIMTRVAQRSFEGTPAVLADHKRRTVRDRPFPGITRAAAEMTEGIVYTGLSPKNLVAIDAFESDFYVRQRVNVHLIDNDLEMTAWVYVVADQHLELLSTEAWDLRYFIDTHLNTYLARWDKD